MGNVMSGIYSVSDYGYQNFYPKNKWLQPRYVAPTLMGAKIIWLLTKQEVPKQMCACNNMMYLLSAGANLGIQLWISFVSPTTFYVIPRHEFGKVQASLFPKYFFLTTLFSFGSLSAFLKQNPLSVWTGPARTLGALLFTSFVVNALNLTCFGVNSIKHNLKMHEIEKGVGAGVNTIGPVISSQLDINPDYAKEKRVFHRFHAYCSTANLISLGCTLGQFYFMSKKSLM